MKLQKSDRVYLVSSQGNVSTLECTASQPITLPGVSLETSQEKALATFLKDSWEEFLEIEADLREVRSATLVRRRRELLEAITNALNNLGKALDV